MSRFGLHFSTNQSRYDRWVRRIAIGLLAWSLLLSQLNTKALQEQQHRGIEQRAQLERQAKVQAHQTDQIRDLIAARSEARDDALVAVCERINNENRVLIAAADQFLDDPAQLDYFHRVLAPVDCTSPAVTGAN